MSKFNLSINDYNINELKDLLNLVDPYTLEDIVNNENQLREKLLMDQNVTQEKKKGIIKFLKTTKEILIKLKKKEFVNLPTDELLGNPSHPVAKRIPDVVEKINAVPRDETTDSNVSKNTTHKLLCLDSRFRDNYYNTLSTNYHLTLPTTVKNVVSMELSALEIPTTYFQISKSLGNNYFWIRWTCPVRSLLSSLLGNTSKDGTGSLYSDICSFKKPVHPCEAITPFSLTTNPFAATTVPPVPQSSVATDFTPEQLYYYIQIPDGNYQRQPMMRTINEQLKIATQPEMALIYLFQQLGAYYEFDNPAPPPDKKEAWIPIEHLKLFLHGFCATPQASIDEFSTKTVISYMKGTASWNPNVCEGPDGIGNTAAGTDGSSGTLGNSPYRQDNIKFAYAPAVKVQDVFDAVNDPSCNSWLGLYFDKSNGGNGATPYLADAINENSRYSGGQVESPPLDLKSDGGVVGNFGWVLGYRLGYYSGSTAYVSEGSYDGWGVKYIYIIVNDYNKNVNNFCIPAYNESLGRSNILARIGTNSVASSDFANGISITNNVNQDTSIKRRYYFGPVDINRLELQVTDEFGRILNLNNMDYSMAINLICLYD